MVILIIFVVVASLIPRVSQTLGHTRVNRSAYVIAADFLLAQSLAARQHSPVVVTVSSAARTITISQPPPANTVLRTDRFDVNSDLRVDSLFAAPSSVQVMPNGLATTTILVTVGRPTAWYHQVRMTQAGQVRITR